MLTDYHTHLRPDVGDTPPERYFTEANVHRYLEVAAERGVTELGFSEHVYRFREALEVWRHPFWEECAQDGLEEYVDLRGVDEGTRPTREARHRDGLDPGAGRQHRRHCWKRWPWDYVVGSVHFLADGAVDHDGYDAWDSADPDRVWSTYFDMLGDAAASGLFDILAHPDLVKVWGRGRPDAAAPTARVLRPRDRADRRRGRGDRGLDGRPAEAGRARSIPRRDLLEMFVGAGKPVALSSDAHEPENIGHRYDAAVALLRDVGVDRICVFDRREPAARSRSDERRSPHGHRLRLPPLPGVGRPAGARRAWSSRASRDSPGTRTPMSCRTRLTDALLGAAGLGDIGDHFPDDDPRWADADSIELLGIVAGMLTDAGLAHGERRRDRDRRAAAAGPAEGADGGPAGGCARRRAAAA